MTINPNDIGLIAFAIAFAAGLVSFLSPCVLPLVPVYIGYISGVSLSSGELGADSRRATFSHALAFVLGFGLLFVFVGAWIGVAALLLSAVSGTHTGAASIALGGFDRMVKDLLLRVGVVLLAVMAARVADAPLSGDWRIQVGGFVLVWPDRVGPIPQKYVRWGLVGVVTALVFIWLSIRPKGVTYIDALLLGMLPLAGVGLSKRGALGLGIAAALVNTWSRLVDPALIHGPIEQLGIVLQAVLIVLAVYYFSLTTLFYQEKRFQVSGRLQNRGYLTSGVMGAVFCAGWTPCTGPALMAILALAGSSGTLATGLALLMTYALGLGLPFLLVGLAFGSATRALRRLTPYLGVVKAVNTGLLLFTAALLWSDRLQFLSQFGSFLPFKNL
jgi:cytochrome c biogenesis protein CcdA